MEDHPDGDIEEIVKSNQFQHDNQQRRISREKEIIELIDILNEFPEDFNNFQSFNEFYNQKNKSFAKNDPKMIKLRRFRNLRNSDVLYTYNRLCDQDKFKFLMFKFSISMFIIILCISVNYTLFFLIKSLSFLGLKISLIENLKIKLIKSLSIKYIYNPEIAKLFRSKEYRGSRGVMDYSLVLSPYPDG